MILVNPRYQLEVIRSTKDRNGRLIILEIKLDNQNLVLANVYAPNDIPQQIKFHQNLNQTLRGSSDSNLIIGGDFNCALTPKDRKSVKQGSNKHTVINEIGNLCSNFPLTDIWRELNPQAQSFTWRDKAFKFQSRLDFFLITADSKYFLHQEKRNFLRKNISRLKLSNGEETDDAETILEEEKTFYKNLYSTRNVNPNAGLGV